MKIKLILYDEYSALSGIAEYYWDRKVNDRREKPWKAKRVEDSERQIENIVAASGLPS